MHQAGPPQQCAPAGNRHNPRDDRNVNTHISTLGHPIQEDIEIIEHLSNDKCCSRIYLGFKKPNVSFDISSLGMTFRIAGHTNIEVIAVSLSDVLNKIDSMMKGLVSAV